MTLVGEPLGFRILADTGLGGSFVSSLLTKLGLDLRHDNAHIA